VSGEHNAERKEWMAEQKNRATQPFVVELNGMVTTMETIKRSLDLSYSVCPCCQKRSYGNWAHKMLYDQFISLQARIMELNDNVRLPEAKGPTNGNLSGGWPQASRQ
jgi:hypothetical protein